MTREKLVRVRLTEEEEIALDSMVKELKEKGLQPNATSSSLVRQALEKWYQFYNQIEAGNVVMVLKTRGLEGQDIKTMYEGLSRLSNEAKTEGREKLVAFYESMKTELDFSISKILEDTNRISKEKLLRELEDMEQWEQKFIKKGEKE